MLVDTNLARLSSQKRKNDDSSDSFGTKKKARECGLASEEEDVKIM
jgi:hypothetical protein